MNSYLVGLRIGLQASLPSTVSIRITIIRGMIINTAVILVAAMVKMHVIQVLGADWVALAVMLIAVTQPDYFQVSLSLMSSTSPLQM